MNLKPVLDKTLKVGATMTLGVLMLSACSDEAAEPAELSPGVRPVVATGFMAYTPSSPPVDITSPPRWRRRGPAHFATVEQMNAYAEAEKNAPHPPNFGPSADEIARWTDADWAKALRPIMLAGDDEYELDATDAEILTRMRIAGAAPTLPPYRGAAPDGASVAPSLATGVGTEAIMHSPDQRTTTGYSSTSFPNRQIGVLHPGGDPWATTSVPNSTVGDCTMTLIGPGTAITAAHCIYNPYYGYLPRAGYAFGQYRTISGSQSWAYQDPNGQEYACYQALFPEGWLNHVDAVTYDYAFIEFYQADGGLIRSGDLLGCYLRPGDSLGWRALPSSADAYSIWTWNFTLNGYPTTLSASTASSWKWPTQNTESVPSGNVWEPAGSNATYVYHNIDATGGQSGSALEHYGYVVATHKGDFGYPAQNWGRVMDGTVYSFAGYTSHH